HRREDGWNPELLRRDGVRPHEGKRAVSEVASGLSARRLTASTTSQQARKSSAALKSVRWRPPSAPSSIQIENSTASAVVMIASNTRIRGSGGARIHAITITP